MSENLSANAAKPNTTAGDATPAGPEGQQHLGQGAPATGKQNAIVREIMGSSGMLIFLSVIVALLISALLVACFNSDVQTAAGYFFARPTDFFTAFGQSFSSFFTSLFRGAIFDYEAATAAGMLLPLTNTLTKSVPLIFAGLSVGLAFQAGLFNIGAQGQLIIGAMLSTLIALNLPLPIGLHLLVAVIAALIGGALWGFVPGILKAVVGANEVIVTIMLNWIGVNLLSWVLKTELMIGTSGYPGKSLPTPNSANYPLLLGAGFSLHLGFILALLVALAVWWLLERSTFGFQLRAAGANPAAASTAGISVKRVITLTMVVAGALAGLAGTAPVLGTEHFMSDGMAGTLGFDAITVALLGKSHPGGIVLAGILFGAFASGAATMQAAADIPVDIVFVSQAIIVLLIAAPPLIRGMFHLPEPVKEN